MPIVKDGNANNEIHTRRVTLLNNPYTNQTTNLPWCLGQDNRGYQYQITLDALPPGVNVNQVKKDQVWFINNAGAGYRLALYAGTTTSPITVTSGAFVGLNNYGSWFSTTTQSGRGQVQAMRFDQPVVSNGTTVAVGITIVSGSQITIANPGVYNLQFSAQFQTATNKAQDVYVWLRHSGVDEANSATKLTLVGPSQAATIALVAAWNFFTPTTTSGQYFELMWYSADTGMSMWAQDAIASGTLAAGSPYIPEIPSVILTVDQVA